MSKGPYSQFITIRHYQLIIRDLYRKPTQVLPAVFLKVVLGSDILKIQEYADNILATKPEDTLTPPDIFNSNSLLVSAISGCVDKFKWMFENYQFISLIYDKQDAKDPTIFNSPESLEYFITSVIRAYNDANINHMFKCAEGTAVLVPPILHPPSVGLEFSADGIKQILDWLLFSQNTRDDKTLQEWVIYLGYYNTRRKIDYKCIYLTCIEYGIWNLAQQILSAGLIPPSDIQTGRDIIQPSFRAGMIAGNRAFLDFIIALDTQNGEWLGQGRENNFSELAIIIRGWAGKRKEVGAIPTAELLAGYLTKYFQKYCQPSYTNEELGLVNDFINDIVGYLTPELWCVLTNHFSGFLCADKYKLLAKNRFISALSKSNLQMSKLLLGELLVATGKPSSCDWVIHIPDDTLIEICGNGDTDKVLATLNWLCHNRTNLRPNWHSFYSSSKTWIGKYYSPDKPSPLSIIKWIMNDIRAIIDDITYYNWLAFAGSLVSDDCWHLINKDLVEITDMCINNYPILLADAWKLAIKWHKTEVCEFLLKKYPNWIPNPRITQQEYFRSISLFYDFSCWALETFPNELSIISADLVYELITNQYGYYKLFPLKLAELLALFPINDNISQMSDYIFHYAQRMINDTESETKKELGNEWRKVLYKICLLDPERYSVSLDAEHPTNLSLAQFELATQYTFRDVNCVEQCPICQLDMATLITSCNHQFCGGCITRWFIQQQDQKNCPYCRTNNPELYQITIASTVNPV